MSVIVYTTIFGGSDSLKAAPSGASRCVCFVDDPSAYFGETRGWELRKHIAENPRREAWRLRCISHVLFPEADKTVWIDASFTLTNLPKLLLDSSGHLISGLPHQSRINCYEEGRKIISSGQWDAPEIHAQLRRYQDEGYREDRLTIACILVRQRATQVTAFNERWDTEIRTNAGDNTQLSLDYSAWKSGLQIHHLRGVRKNNPYAIHDHDDHKKRRVPYLVTG